MLGPCEVPEDEGCALFLSLLLTPRKASGMKLVFSDFGLHLILLN